MPQHAAQHPSSSLHDDLMNIPEELREFMGVVASKPSYTEHVDQDSDDGNDDDDDDDDDVIGDNENIEEDDESE